MYELCRNGIAKLMPMEKTPCWHYFCARQDDGGNKVKYSLPDLAATDENWFRISRPFHIHEHISFDFDAAIKAFPRLKGIAFIFFMGAGDYLYATPLFPALKKKYPRLDFIAIAGDSNDRNNSALVARLLSHNPLFSSVKTFPGGRRHPVIWKNYDYRAAIQLVPENYLAVPVYYDYSVNVSHREHTLFETYGLSLPGGENIEKVPCPQMYFPGEPSDSVKQYLSEIEMLCQATGKKDIVFLQLDSRGSNYTYPYLKELARLLSGSFTVLSVTKGISSIKGCLELDIKKLEMNDTFRLLAALKEKHSVRVIAVNSVFWAASAGLGLPNLGLQHWHDPKLHNLWYPNIAFLTDIIYPRIPEKYQIIAAPSDWKRHNKKIIDFLPEFVFNKFQDLILQEK